MNSNYRELFSNKEIIFLPLGVIAVVLLPPTLAFLLGGVKMFLVGRVYFFLLEAGVRGGGNTNMSLSFS